MADQTFKFDAIGTRWHIHTAGPLSRVTAGLVQARVSAFDALYSRFRADSAVSSLRSGPGRLQVPESDRGLFTLYRQLYDATDGAVTPLVGLALEHLGYDRDYSLRRSPGLVRTPQWDEVLRVDEGVLTTSEPVVLDLGAAGKGYLVDAVAEILRMAGISDFVVDASGDLLHHGAGVERVGLEDPHHPGWLIGTVTVANQALCASAITRRRWGDGLHHVIDPATGEPVGTVVATWVSSDFCSVADGLATALFFVDPDQLWPHFTFEYARLNADGSADFSAGLDGELFT